jgi:hypothetical protein
MAVPEAAACAWKVNIRTIYRWMDFGRIHFLEVPGGILVCLNSIDT